MHKYMALIEERGERVLPDGTKHKRAYVALVDADSESSAIGRALTQAFDALPDAAGLVIVEIATVNEPVACENSALA